jgi:hypothetical protein
LAKLRSPLAAPDGRTRAQHESRCQSELLTLSLRLSDSAAARNSYSGGYADSERTGARLRKPSGPRRTSLRLPEGGLLRRRGHSRQDRFRRGAAPPRQERAAALRRHRQLTHRCDAPAVSDAAHGVARTQLAHDDAAATESSSRPACESAGTPSSAPATTATRPACTRWG